MVIVVVVVVLLLLLLLDVCVEFAHARAGGTGWLFAVEAFDLFVAVDRPI